MSMERVQRENPNVTEGGKYTPPDCRAKQKVAIIIPFRHREHHLKYWLHYLHPILRRQKIDYGIYIINQVCVCVFEFLAKPPDDNCIKSNCRFEEVLLIQVALKILSHLLYSSVKRCEAYRDVEAGCRMGWMGRKVSDLIAKKV